MIAIIKQLDIDLSVTCKPNEDMFPKISIVCAKNLFQHRFKRTDKRVKNDAVKNIHLCK